MDCTPSLVDLFCHSFPEIDRRVVKATVLEYGNDIEAAITDLVDISDQIKDTTFLDRLKVQCCSLLCPADEDVAEQQASSKEELPPVVGVLDQVGSSTTENMVPDASDSQTNAHSPPFVEPSSSVNDTLVEPASPLVRVSKPPEKLANSIDIVNVASALECTVQEARTETDNFLNLINEVSDLRIKAEQERLTAQNAEIEAARGGEDLLMKACEVNKQTQKMKQDNLKLSWEIHGEKSVLALEAEELNVRLEQMKQQKEKAVTTLHELRETLQSCYDTALEDRKMADEDKRLKEEKAGKVLEQEEELMAVVEQETKTLKMEAETCTLLRDFLVDHGSIVDGLQGDINNLCEEVKCLKKLVQGTRNAAVNPELRRNSDTLYNLRSNSISSAASSGAMTNSSASQYSPSLEGNHQGKPQFLYGSGGGSMVAKLFDGTTEDGSFGYMNNGNSGLRSNMPMQERPFIWNSYGLQATGVFPYVYGMRDQHPPAHGEHGEVFVDSDRFGSTSPYQAGFNSAPHGGDNNGYGYPQGVSHHPDHVFGGHENAQGDPNTYRYPQVALPNWSSNLDNGLRNLVGNDWVLAPKTQGSTPSGSDNFSLV